MSRDSWPVARSDSADRILARSPSFVARMRKMMDGVHPTAVGPSLALDALSTKIPPKACLSESGVHGTPYKTAIHVGRIRLWLRGSFRLQTACAGGGRRSAPPDETSIATTAILPYLVLIGVYPHSSGASVKLSLSCDLKGGHHGMTRLPCSPAGMPAGNRAV